MFNLNQFTFLKNQAGGDLRGTLVSEASDLGAFLRPIVLVKGVEELGFEVRSPTGNSARFFLTMTEFDGENELVAWHFASFDQPVNAVVYND